MRKNAARNVEEMLIDPEYLRNIQAIMDTDSRYDRRLGQE